MDEPPAEVAAPSSDGFLFDWWASTITDLVDDEKIGGWSRGDDKKDDWYPRGTISKEEFVIIY